MVTTIKSSALDFDNIKSNLKDYLANKDEFKDYNFEASGLSNILDVLAYNTHLNALIANFALNESYLPTAQLRSSMVSLAEGIGYVPDTKTAAQARVRLTLSSTAAGRKTKISLPAYTKFTTSVDDVTYTFQTIESYEAEDDGTNTVQGNSRARPRACLDPCPGGVPKYSPRGAAHGQSSRKSGQGSSLPDPTEKSNAFCCGKWARDFKATESGKSWH